MKWTIQITQEEQNRVIEQATDKHIPLVEIIPGNGGGQLKKRVLRFFNQSHIRNLYHRVEKDEKKLGASLSIFVLNSNPGGNRNGLSISDTNFLTTSALGGILFQIMASMIFCINTNNNTNTNTNRTHQVTGRWVMEEPDQAKRV